MQDIFYKMLYFAVIFSLVFGAVWLYGRKSFPKLAMQLSLGAWVAMMTVSYFSGFAAGLISVPLILSFMYVLRKPNQRKALLQFYEENKIYSSKQVSQAVLDALGNKNWRYAEGTLNKNAIGTVKYLFWQGRTSSLVSAGQFTRTTTYQHYLAFIFPPGSAGNIFKQHALAAADRSGYTFRQKLKFFFTVDTDKPARVMTAADGSFIIEYNTIPDLEHYTKQLNWIKEYYNKMYVPASEFISAY